MLNGIATHHEEEENNPMTGTDATTRLFDKLDQMQAGQATIMADVARVQGAQSGMQTAIQTVSNAIGDVNEVKLESRETSIKITHLEKQINALKATVDAKDTRSWVEGLVKYAVAGLGIGVGGGGALAVIQKVF